VYAEIDFKFKELIFKTLLIEEKTDFISLLSGASYKKAIGF